MVTLAVRHEGGNPVHWGTRIATSDEEPLRPGTYRQEVSPPPFLAIFGAGDDAIPLARLAHGLGWRVVVADPRAALNTAAASNAYVLSDRGTWISFKNKGDLVIAVEGDKRLFNQYGVMLVNPAKHAHVKKELGQAFVDWLISAEGQKTISDYKISGAPLFFPNAQ